ncbi:hypothetical protein X924_03640 [Petrotoga sp. 9PWA.NaAc.5.4]|nr:hypothetical protein X924_03640 [Petrotoga sp. 9PWA.NaAc.5.4]
MGRGLRPGPTLNSKAYFSKIFNSKVLLFFIPALEISEFFSVLVPKEGRGLCPGPTLNSKAYFSKVFR